MPADDIAPTAQETQELRELARDLPDGVLLAVLLAIRDDSALPLMELPEPWRGRALSAFRQVVR